MVARESRRRTKVGWGGGTSGRRWSGRKDDESPVTKKRRVEEKTDTGRVGFATITEATWVARLGRTAAGRRTLVSEGQIGDLGRSWRKNRHGSGRIVMRQ
ncbi:hypothetical protein LWI29_017196 [Acer saccharum]|uniref:Uncharacterized protein n=1 Tax=Acer saccharum TaxID=4024 RepID=A0AA39TGD9_ACESA|nr:hypothetical protein LWI29_017196 [Acer saccharum]